MEERTLPRSGRSGKSRRKPLMNWGSRSNFSWISWRVHLLNKTREIGKLRLLSLEGWKGRSRQKSPSAAQAGFHELSSDHHSDQSKDPLEWTRLKDVWMPSPIEVAYRKLAFLKRIRLNGRWSCFHPKFKLPALYVFDSTKSAKWHICCFKVQIENLVAIDALFMRLFISTLYYVAFN